MAREYDCGDESFSPEEQRSLKYLNYPGRPQVMKASLAIDGGWLHQNEDNSVSIKDKETGETVRIDERYQYSMVEITLEGLNIALVDAEKGVTLREKLNGEIEKYYADPNRYGHYVYYPDKGMFVHYASRRMHQLALVASSSRLLQHPDKKMSWEETRDILSKVTPGIAGASVGNSIAHTLSMTLGCQSLKIADPSPFKLTNLNRVRAGFLDIKWSEEQAVVQGTFDGSKNKAVTTAQQIHSKDPFVRISAYDEGVKGFNVESFVDGNRCESKCTCIIEETDDLNTKVELREECRRKGVRLIMVTDAGSIAHVGIRPFDTDPNATLAYGASDDELYSKLRDYNLRGDKESFFGVADLLIGPHYKRDEFKGIIDGKIQRVFASIAQLGSTAMTGSGIVTEVIARTALGHKYPEGFMLDQKNLELISWGEEV